MSENRDEATGQFAPSEPLIGRAGLEHDAGFKPMPASEPEAEPDFKDARDAADASTGPEAVPLVEVFYQKTADGERIDGSETVTPERAAKDLTAYRNANADSAAKSISGDFAAEIDKMRADVIKGDPKVAEHLGVEVPPEASDSEQPRANSNNSGDEVASDDPTAAAIDAMDGLAPETKQALKNPQIRAALEEEFGKVQQVKDSFSQALNTVQSWAQASFLESFPELSGLPAEQMEHGLALLAQADPPRFNAAMNLLGRVQTIQAAQQQEQHRQAQIAHQNFETYAKEQDAAFEAMIGKMSPAENAEFGAELTAYAGELGVSQQQLVQLLQTEPVMRHAAFQKMVHDAIRYRQIQKTSRATAKRDVPPVMRPGTASAVRRDGNASDIQALERKMTNATPTQQLKLAAQITGLKRAARG
ncbi:hypothetical protein AB4853_10415 [Bradyrhizobium sp. 1050_B9_N1_2]|uniref:hypothetical protein n=1 Tax=Bradyrhizobium sp. 1050_B9_N1_2 TaxID=3238688 RepID=UPI003EDC212F